MSHIEEQLQKIIDFQQSQEGRLGALEDHEKNNLSQKGVIVTICSSILGAVVTIMIGVNWLIDAKLEPLKQSNERIEEDVERIEEDVEKLSRLEARIVALEEWRKSLQHRR